MAWEVRDAANAAINSIKDIDLNLKDLSFITLDDKPLDLSNVKKKIKNLVEEAAGDVKGIQNIDD